MRCEPAVCASHSTVKNPSGATGESKALSDVPIMIPKREDDPSKSKETEGTAEVKSNCCQSGTDIRACIDEGCWQAGRQDGDVYPNARSLLPTISKDRQRLVVYQRSRNELRGL